MDAPSQFPQLTKGASVDPAQRLDFLQLRAEPTFPVLSIRPMPGVWKDEWYLHCALHGVASLPGRYDDVSGTPCPGCLAAMEQARYGLFVRLAEGRQ